MTSAIKLPFSGQTDGKGIVVTGTATGSAVTIHTAVNVADQVDEIWVWAYNSDTTNVVLFLEYGETGTPIKTTVPLQTGLVPMLPGTILLNGMVLKAYASTGSVCKLFGFVNRITMTAGSTGSQPYDIPFYLPGVPTASQMLRFKLPRAISFAANFAGSQFTATANATASTVFDIQKNGVSIGTCTIGAGGTTPTFATSGGAAQSFAVGDVIALIAPATPDATLADPAITLVGTR